MAHYDRAGIVVCFFVKAADEEEAGRAIAAAEEKARPWATLVGAEVEMFRRPPAPKRKGQCHITLDLRLRDDVRREESGGTDEAFWALLRVCQSRFSLPTAHGMKIHPYWASCPPETPNGAVQSI